MNNNIYSIEQLIILKSDSKIVINFDFQLEVNRRRNRNPVTRKNGSMNQPKSKAILPIKKQFINNQNKEKNSISLQKNSKVNLNSSKGKNIDYGFKKYHKVEDKCHFQNTNNSAKRMDFVFIPPYCNYEDNSFPNRWSKDKNPPKYLSKVDLCSQIRLDNPKNQINNSRKILEPKMTKQNYTQNKDCRYISSFSKGNIVYNPPPFKIVNPYSTSGFYPSNFGNIENISEEYETDDSDYLSSSSDNFIIIIDGV